MLPLSTVAVSLIVGRLSLGSWSRRTPTHIAQHPFMPFGTTDGYKPSSITLFETLARVLLLSTTCHGYMLLIATQGAMPYG